MQTITSSTSEALSNLLLHFVPRCSCEHAHTQLPSQEHFLRAGLDTITSLALAVASQISHINCRDSRCCREAKSLLLRWASSPRRRILRSANHVAQLRSNTVWFCTEARLRAPLLLEISIAVCTSTCIQITKNRSVALKEALCWGSVALQLSCGFKPD